MSVNSSVGEHRLWETHYCVLLFATRLRSAPNTATRPMHGKGSLIGKMPGDEWQRFANLTPALGDRT